MDFVPAIRCHCGKADLVIIDHCAPWYEFTASLDWRYEVTCDECLDCDANGYANKREIIEEYSSNTKEQEHDEN